MTRTPSMAAVLDGALSARLRGVRVMLPARVETYDSARCEIDAQPLILEGFKGEDGARDTERLPVITGVPVVFPGSGGVRVKFPITVGDTVMLVFSSSSLDLWLARGGEVDPEDDRRHCLADAVAIPGLQDFANVADASPMIEFTAAGKINAGGSAALALKTELDTLKSAISGAAVSAGDGGATFKANIIAALSGWPVGTSILKGS